MATELAHAVGIAGSLRFFGDWFGGRPYENVHRLTRVEAQEDSLILRFDAGELLTVWQPQGLEVREKREYPYASLVIGRASRVRWESYYYGRPQVAENLRLIDYVVADEGVRRSTNWEPQLQGRSSEDSSKPAVELF